MKRESKNFVTGPEVSAQEIETLLYRALTEEARLSPKPGLVDGENSGAHSDMDLALLEASAAAISPHLANMFSEGKAWSKSPQGLFPRIREIGKAAEQDMFRVTGGVNTHKGAIFVMGILAAAAGADIQGHDRFDAARILRFSGKMTAPALTRELSRIRAGKPVSHGDALYLRYGAAGVRGEAMAGFPGIAGAGLPALRESRQRDRRGRLLETLLRLIAATEDTTILHRAGEEGLRWAKSAARCFLTEWTVLDENACAALRRLNDAFCARRISPGGSADLLAATIFLDALERMIISHERVKELSRRGGQVAT